MEQTSKPVDAMESRIINAAQELFVERGYRETNMSDIAARVGVNRPAVNYYFRTKERLFQAVLGGIVSGFIPRVVGTIVESSLPVEERIERVVGIYIEVFAPHPFMPLFLVRELHRDFSLIKQCATELGMLDNLQRIRETLMREMEAGHIRRLPLRIIILSFISQVASPFVALPLIENLLLDENESLQNFLNEWKPLAIANLTNLLTPRSK